MSGACPSPASCRGARPHTCEPAHSPCPEVGSADSWTAQGWCARPQSWDPGSHCVVSPALLNSLFCLVAQCVRLCVTPWTVAHQAPLSMGFSRQDYWSGLPFPPQGDLPDPGIKPFFPALQVDSTAEPPGKPLVNSSAPGCMYIMLLQAPVAYPLSPYIDEKASQQELGGGERGNHHSSGRSLVLRSMDTGLLVFVGCRPCSDYFNPKRAREYPF